MAERSKKFQKKTCGEKLYGAKSQGQRPRIPKRGVERWLGCRWVCVRVFLCTDGMGCGRKGVWVCGCRGGVHHSNEDNVWPSAAQALGDAGGPPLEGRGHQLGGPRGVEAAQPPPPGESAARQVDLRRCSAQSGATLPQARFARGRGFVRGTFRGCNAWSAENQEEEIEGTPGSAGYRRRRRRGSARRSA